MVYSAIRAAVGMQTRNGTSPTGDALARINLFINLTQQELAGLPSLRSLRVGQTTLTTTAGRAEYTLPWSTARLVTIRDTTNRWALRQQSLSWYRQVYPNTTTQTGTPTDYVELGLRTVLQQPAAATGLWIASSSAADASFAYLTAIRTGGYPSQVTVTMNGTTRVQFGTLTDYIEVYDWYAAGVGEITLYDAASGGNALSVIPRNNGQSARPWIALAPTPSAALTYALDYERTLLDLDNDNDTPEWLPEAFHPLLIAGAKAKEYEFQGDSRLAVAQQEFNRMLVTLIATTNNPPGQVLVPGGGRLGRSDLGPGYPAGTIFD